ncbi:NAD(P)/FAD-dependent oxidoreductase, partial [bacterium]|nr:NAD(P)/FAD-dependent oxidoreductase [bacterium]
DLSSIPKKMLIVGGGVIGCEFAGIFSQLGSQVTIVEMMSQILPGKDEEVARCLVNILSRKGIDVYTNARVESIKNASSSLICKLDNGREFQVDKVVVAVGRHLNTDNIGLQKAGILTQEGKILVNERMQTNIPNFYAAGDITGGPYLAHLASLKGLIAAENACGKEKVFNYRAIPECIYTYPEVASIGLTCNQAKNRNRPVKVGKAMFMANGRALTLDQREGFIKVISDVDNGEILGVHIVGAQASELINLISLAMNRGLKVVDLIESVYAHPTLAECIKEAAEKVLN